MTQPRYAWGSQTQTITGFLLAHHLLKVNPKDVNVLDLPKQGSLYRACCW